MSRWMAIDLYIREIDSLRFELSMNRCSDRLSRLADEILEKGMLLGDSSCLSFFLILESTNLEDVCFCSSETSAQDHLESWGPNVGRSQPKFPSQQGLSLPTQLPPRADLPSCAGKGFYA